MEREKAIVKVSVVGIGVNAVLVAFKLAVGFISGSIAIILDGVNNLTDALSSVVTIVGTRLAGKAPDKKHPYGYGKIEYISSVTVAVIILLAGVTAFRESLDKALHPTAAGLYGGRLRLQHGGRNFCRHEADIDRYPSGISRSFADARVLRGRREKAGLLRLDPGL